MLYSSMYRVLAIPSRLITDLGIQVCCSRRKGKLVDRKSLKIRGLSIKTKVMRNSDLRKLVSRICLWFLGWWEVNARLLKIVRVGNLSGGI